MNHKPQKLPLTTMRLQKRAVRNLRRAELFYQSKNKIKPNHSEALEMAVSAWVREIDAAAAEASQAIT